ncbi:hypothetical protein ACFV0C_23770 [Streptomyces sp. NPDC059568]|uniref:hypothetical protein n=1 Tax=Streptomyces sp. NPDC059568 TaxID=3346868 RepID=UPI0036A417AE
MALSDGRYRSRLDLAGLDPATVVPEGCVAAALHARHKRLEEVVERIGSALGAPADGAAALLQELTRRSRQGPPLVIVAHSLGSVIAYEALCAHPDWPDLTLVTLGSPLAVRGVVFDRLAPPPPAGRPAGPCP